MTARVAITFLCFGLLGINAHAQSCLQSPTGHNLVVGRFGDPAGGADGLIFSSGGLNKPVYAVASGKVVYMGIKGSAGNVLSIELENGDIVTYENLKGFTIGNFGSAGPGSSFVKSTTYPQGSVPWEEKDSWKDNWWTKSSSGELVLTVVFKVPQYTNAKNAKEVKAGQEIAIASNNVKLTYQQKNKDQSRIDMFTDLKSMGSAFNPGQLPYAFNNDVGYKTDPSPYFCQTFPIDDGQPSRDTIIGGDTKSQFNLMVVTPPSGGVSLGAGLDAAQVTAANIKVALANDAGKTQLEFLTDTDGFGTLPTPPAGAYENMSVNEMMLTEASRRFRDAEWNNKLTQVSSRALWVDYAKATGVANFLDDAIYRKKERIEALLAVYSSMKMKGIKAETVEAHEGALSEKSRNDIQ